MSPIKHKSSSSLNKDNEESALSQWVNQSANIMTGSKVGFNGTEDGGSPERNFSRTGDSSTLSRAMTELNAKKKKKKKTTKKD